MKAKMKMGWAVACGCMMLVAACSTYTSDGIQPPVLNKNQSELVEIRGTIDFGQTVLAQKYSETKPLVGWVFDANSGARVTAMLKASNGEAPLLVLYGPQDNNGAFGTAVKMDSAGVGGLDAALSNLELKNGGRFLIAVGTARGAQGGTFDLALGCSGGNCEEPRCEDVACDLYCENGYMVDPNGCPICMCAEVECQTDEDCLNTYPWVQFARCVDGRCQFDMYCDEATPCPEGFACVQDACPLMPCTEDDCPPCPGHCEPTNQGECDENTPCPPGFVCAMECWDDACDPATGENCKPDYCDPAGNYCTGSGGTTCVGRCVPETIECQDSSQCPAGQVCELSCWECDDTIPPCGEPRACQIDEDCMDAGMTGRCVNGVCDTGCQECVPGCVGHCVPRQLECQSDAECPPGFYCAVECWEADCDAATGECPPCEPGPDGQCQPVCRGVCLPYGQQFCNGDFDCIDAAGQQGRCVNGVCVFGDCNCPDIWEPVCAAICQEWCDPDGGCGGMCELRTYPNECFARCDGAEIVHPGTCEGEPTCWSDWDCVSPDGQMGRCINGQCVFDNFYCHADWECPPGERCDIFECIPGCWGDVWACCQGVCVQEAQCRTDEDCMVDCQPGTDCFGVQARCIQGRCVYDQCACPEVWDPVCAVKCYEDCDLTDPTMPCTGACVEQTYSNACFAECDGARIVHAGTCEQPPGECRTDADCPPGTYCEFCIGTDGNGPCTDVGVCLPLPQMYCEQDADCPDGFRCELFCPPCPSGDPNCAGCDAIGGQCVPVQGDCVVSGCNGEICAAFPMESDCMWRPEYECLRLTTCGLQAENGVAFCGWAQTQEYLDCLANIQGGQGCQDDSQCAAGEYCQVSCSSDGTCRGVCVQDGCVCPEFWEPVCGVDGQTYSNICFLSCANMELAYFGECR